MLFLTFLEQKSVFLNIEKFPFTYWLNGRWFLQIVDREFEHGVKRKVVPTSQIVDGDSGNLYPIYPPFPCYDF